MSDLNDELAALGRVPLPEVTDEQVAGDLMRGRKALRRRRLWQGGGAVIVTVAVSLAGSALGMAGTDGSDTPTVAERTTTASPTADPQPSLRLVAWRGRQLRGFTVAAVPRGYVLRGVTASALVIAPPRLHDPLLSAPASKIVVRLDTSPAREGWRVNVAGRPYFFAETRDAQVVLYDDDRGHHVRIEKGREVDMSRAQLIAFARGVTVTSQAKPGS